jgi:hypothetical protein
MAQYLGDDVDSDVVILEKGDRFRLALLPEYDPDEPEDEGSMPLWRIDRRGARRVEISNYEEEIDLDGAVHRWHSMSPMSHEMIGRRLRAFHCATQVEWWSHQGIWYVAHDTEKWRAWSGASIANVAREAETSLMAAWKAYQEGDVWSYVIQRKVVWLRSTPNIDPHVPDGLGSAMHTWQTVEALSALYGRDYAEEAAREDYAAFIAAHIGNPQVETEGTNPEPQVEGEA